MLKTLQETVTDFLNVASNLPTDSLIAYHRMASCVHILYAAIREAENMQISRAEILTAIKPVRLLCSQSPFIARMQRWPRGYPGDFETIEYLCNNSVKAAPNTPAFYLDHQALRSVAAQQHRNKVQWQAQCISETFLSNDNARILSVACGSCRDIQSIQKFVKPTGTHFFLNDVDLEALRYSLYHLESLSSRITLIPGDVFRSIRKFSKYQFFHLILAGGLFDYLTDRQIEWLIPKLVQLLHNDGSFCFTNIAPGNPDRLLMEYLGDWHIIERSEADIHRLVSNIGDSNNINLSIERDPTGLTLLIKLQKKH